MFYVKIARFLNLEYLLTRVIRVNELLLEIQVFLQRRMIAYSFHMQI